MRRRISILLATVLAAAGFTVLIPGEPVAAWTVCGGMGFADIVGGGILFLQQANTPGKDSLVADILLGDLTGNPTYGFNFYFEPPALTVPGGTCAHPQTSPPGVTTNKTPTLSTPMGGIILGYCDFASGRGTFSTNTSLFAFIIVGTTAIFTGHVIGVGRWTADFLSGQSCFHTGAPSSLPGAGALRFRVDLLLILLNCDANLQTLVPGTPNDTETLLPQVLQDVLTAGVPVHVKIHLSPHIFYNHQCVGDPVL